MRRSLMIAAAILTIALAARKANAQSALLNLPNVSQRARLTQRVGITDITIDFSRPQVRGRKIFGGLQPYGKVWRAGADSWVVIFSKNATSWGSFTYDQSEDALRLTVKPQPIENEEVLTYEFDDPTRNSAIVTMKWERVAIPFKIEVNTPQIVEQSLRNQLRGRPQFEWQAWQEAASYLLQNQLDPQEAEQYAEHSIQIEDRFETEITRARALTALGRSDDAAAARKKAVAMGNQSQIHDYARGLQAQGHQDEALALFSDNIAKDPNSWIGYNEAARVAVAHGDFDTAVKEMKLAAAAATGTMKSQNADLVTLLENHVDINK